jgi:uncharacterized protein YkwD
VESVSGTAVARSTPATTAGVRLLAAIAVVAAAAAVSISVPAADGATGSLLAPAGACPGADDPRASHGTQARAIVCLVNHARRRAARQALAAAPKLERASALKGNVVVSCGQVTHSPCGADPAASVQAAGYRYAWFGENIWLGTWGAFSARHVVQSWLASPGHRANILRPAFRHFGVARVRARGVFGEASTAVWVATFASPR